MRDFTVLPILQFMTSILAGHEVHTSTVLLIPNDLKMISSPHCAVSAHNVC